MTRPRTLAIAFALAITSTLASAQTTAPTNALPNPYRTIENWGQLPDGRKWGSTSAVTVDPDGTSVWVAERCGEVRPPNQITPGNPFACAESTLAPIMKFDTNGKLLKSFGAGHGTVSARHACRSRGQRLGHRRPRHKGKGHQVFKFSPDGKLLLTLGKAGAPGSGPDEFNAPSAVATAPNGDIFVADGHGGNTNARIVKFAKDGKFIKTWGRTGSAPGEFDMPHAIAMDSPAGCSSATGGTTASRSSIRTASSSTSGSSSAGRAGSTSIRKT